MAFSKAQLKRMREKLDANIPPPRFRKSLSITEEAYDIVSELSEHLGISKAKVAESAILALVADET